MLLPSGVSSAMDENSAASARRVLSAPVYGDEFRCHPVTQGDGSGLVEKNGIDIAGSFNRSPAHGQDIVLKKSVHPRDPDGRQEPADSRGHETHEESHQHRQRYCMPI